MDVKIVTNQTKNAGCTFQGCDYTLMADCATGFVEVVISHLNKKAALHNFVLEVKFDAGFNSNLKNADAIAVSNLSVAKALMQYENSHRTDPIDYEIGSHDSELIKLAIKQDIVDRIKDTKAKTILRDEVLGIVFNDEIPPEKRVYGDALSYVAVNYNEQFDIERTSCHASGSIPFIIEGKRSVVADFSVSYEEKYEKGRYLGGKLVVPKEHKVTNMAILGVTYKNWADADGNKTAPFKLSRNEEILIKENIINEVKEHLNADAYPETLDYYLAT